MELAEVLRSEQPVPHEYFDLLVEHLREGSVIARHLTNLLWKRGEASLLLAVATIMLEAVYDAGRPSSLQSLIPLAANGSSFGTPMQHENGGTLKSIRAPALHPRPPRKN